MKITTHTLVSLMVWSSVFVMGLLAGSALLRLIVAGYRLLQR